jgi:hypothetical protein
MKAIRVLAGTLIVVVLTGLALATGCGGTNSQAGPAGVGIESIVSNGNGTFTVKLTDGSSFTTDNFTGPQGPKGDQGVQGVKGDTGLPGAGVAWKGEWSSSTVYSQYDGVGYLGSSYVSRQNGNTNHVPTDTNWWDLWIAKGDTGAAGAKGDKGDTGVGPSPGYATVITWETTYDNLTSGNLPTVGPSVTVTIGTSGSALVTVHTGVQASSNCFGYIGFAVSGATSRPMNSSQEVGGGTETATTTLESGATFVVTGLNPGANTFTAEYNAILFHVGGYVAFFDRSIIVQPL